MPILHTRIPTGSTPEQKEALLTGLTEAVVQEVGAPLASVRVTLEEVEPAHTIVGGKLAHPMAFVELLLIEGRTPEVKAAVVGAIADTLERVIGVSKQDSRTLIIDVPTTDMGVAGGITAKAAGR